MTDRRYIDVHILQTVPPANLNRDDQGNPKEAYFGGVRRSRVSSQAWKRATRIAFAERVPRQDLATRTKRISSLLAKRLAARTGLEAEQAVRLSTALLDPLGIKAGRKATDTAYLLFFGYPQLEAIVNLVADRAGELAALSDSDLAKAVKELPISVSQTLQSGHPMDVALFGRMVANIPTLKVDAAVQVAHALSTHAVELEFDYYTAIDDEKEKEKEETGAEMIGTVGFNSATLYRYATINLHQLINNLGDPTAALDTVDLFIDAFTRSIPSGHTNTFAHQTLPSLVVVAVREDQPVNLVSAFEEPVRSTGGIAAASAIRLAQEFDRINQQWTTPPAHLTACYTFAPETEAGKHLQQAFGPSTPFQSLLTQVREALTPDAREEL